METSRQPMLLPRIVVTDHQSMMAERPVRISEAPWTYISELVGTQEKLRGDHLSSVQVLAFVCAELI